MTSYRVRASSYEDEDRYSNQYSVHPGSTAAATNPTVNQHIYSAQDLHRYSQNADRFSTATMNNVSYYMS